MYVRAAANYIREERTGRRVPAAYREKSEDCNKDCDNGSSKTAGHPLSS